MSQIQPKISPKLILIHTPNSSSILKRSPKFMNIFSTEDSKSLKNCINSLKRAKYMKTLINPDDVLSYSQKFTLSKRFSKYLKGINSDESFQPFIKYLSNLDSLSLDVNQASNWKSVLSRRRLYELTITSEPEELPLFRRKPIKKPIPQDRKSTRLNSSH